MTHNESVTKLLELLPSDIDSKLEAKFRNMDISQLETQLSILQKLADEGRQIRKALEIPEQESLAQLRDQRRAELIGRMTGAMNALASSIEAFEATTAHEVFASTFVKLKFLSENKSKASFKNKKVKRIKNISVHANDPKPDFVVIRLVRGGVSTHLFYDVIVTKSNERPERGIIEKIGVYKPGDASREGALSLDMESIKRWLDAGAKSSKKVEHLISLHAQNQTNK